MLRIIWNPGKVFESINEAKFKSGKTIIVLMILVILISFLNIPIQNEIMTRSSLAEKISPDQMEMAQTIRSRLQYVKVVFAAIQFLVKIALFSLLLKWGAMIFKGDARYMQFFSILACSYFIVLIGDILNLSLIYMSGIQYVENQYDTYKIGLNIFFDVNQVGVPIYLFLSYINPFQIWFLSLLAVGISRIAKVKLGYSFLIVVIFFLITILVPILITTCIENMISEINVM